MFFKLETGELGPRMIQYTPLGGPWRTLVGSNTSGTQIFGLRRPIAVGNDVSHAFLRKKVPGLQIPGPRKPLGGPSRTLVGSNTSGTQIFGLRRPIALGNNVSHAFLRKKVPGLQIPVSGKPLGGASRTLVGSNTSGTQIFGLRRPIAVINDVSHAFLRKKVPGLQIPGPREAPGRALEDLGGVQHLWDANIWA